MMMCGLTGTLFIYLGQEIGMINVPKHWPIAEYRDIESLNFYRTVAKATDNDPEELESVMKGLRILGRDNARIPMQWDSSPHAGFTDRPEGGWIRTHDLYPEINVEKQQAEPDSVLNFWKHMLRLRKQHGDVFTHGSFHVYEPDDDKTFVFAKKRGEKTVLVVLNLTGEEQGARLPLQGLAFHTGNYGEAEAVEAVSSTVGEETRLLRPWEGRLYMV